MIVIDAILTNSKVTVASDVSVPIDVIFIIGGYGGGTARDVSQGSGRYRNCDVIHMFLMRDKHEGKLTTKQMAMQYIEDNEHLRNHHYRAIQAILPQFHNGRFAVPMDHRIIGSLANSLAEEMSCFNTKLLSIFVQSGYTILPYSGKRPDQLRLAAKEWMTLKKKDPESVDYKAAIDSSLAPSNAIKNPTNKQVKYLKDVSVMMERFKPEALKLIPSHIWLDLVQKPEMLIKLKQYALSVITPEQLFEVDKYTLKNAQLTTKTEIAQECVRTFNDVIAMIGLSGGSDLTSLMCLELEPSRLETLEKHHDNLAMWRGTFRPKVNPGSKNKPDAIAIVRSILGTFGRIVVSTQVGSARKGERVTVHTMGLFSFDADMDVAQLAGHMKPRTFEEVKQDIAIVPKSKRQKANV